MIDTPTRQQRPQRIPTTAESFWLVPVLNSSDIGPSVLSDGTTEIGSESTCDIFLPVPGVDAHHCSIRTDNGRATLTAHSRMTWVNDGPVSSAVLKPGQRLAVGPVEFRIERRPRTVPPHPLEQVAELQRAVSEEIREPAAPSVTPTPSATDGSRSIPPGQPPAPTESASVAAMPPAAMPRVPDPRVDNDSAAAQELERRRTLVEELQASLTEQTCATLQSLKEHAAAQQKHNDEVSRLQGELSAGRAELLNDRAALARRQDELQRQSLRLQENEQSLCTRQAEFGQSLEQLEQQRRDLYARENLLQQRIEEINQSEAAHATREAELLKRQQEWEQRCADRDTAAEDQAERVSFEAEREAFSAQRQKLDEDLQNLHQQQQAWEVRLEETRVLEARLTEQQSERERQQRELEAREASVREREQELEALANAPQPEQGDDLKQVREDLDRSREELDQTRQSLLNERERLEEATAALREQQQSLRTDQLELRASQAATEQQTSEREAARVKLDELQEQLEQQREQLTRDRETFAAEQARAAADRENAKPAPEKPLAATGTLPEAENGRQAVSDAAPHSDQHSDQHPDQYEVTDASSGAPADSDADSFDDEIVDDEVITDEIATGAELNADLELAADSDVAEAATPPAAEVDTSENTRAGTDLQSVAEQDGSAGLRSQLAELFGLSADELNARATDDHTDSDTDSDADGHTARQPPPSETLREEERQHEGQTAPEELPPPEERTQHEHALNDENLSEESAQTASAGETASPVPEPEGVDPSIDAELTDEPDDKQEPDSISAYMERLIARNRGSVQGARMVAAGESVPRPKPRKKATTTTQVTAAQPTSDVPESQPETKPRPPRKRPDATLERANINAFRDLANRSARSAVARHNSSSLRCRCVAGATVMAIMFCACVLLMTTSFWFGASYPWWSLLATVAMCLSAYELLKTGGRLQSNKAQNWTDRRETQGQTDETSGNPLLRVVKPLARFAERLSSKRRQASCSSGECEAGNHVEGDRVEGGHVEDERDLTDRSANHR